jgi:arylsulfatase A-like enzyme
MDRREFVKQGIAASVAIGAAPLSLGAVPNPSRKPNVLYIFSDEHRAQSLPGEPYSDVLAPHLTDFRRNNLSFRNCISNYPLCAPHRAILMTGKWPYQTGVIDNGHKLAADPRSLGNIFRSNGYYTGYVGKWHLGEDGRFIPDGPLRQGFKDWHIWARTNDHYDKSFTFDPMTGQKIQPQGYNATLMTDQAVRFLQERKADSSKPWMLMVSWNPPHPPYGDAPPEDLKRYNPEKLTLRPNVKLKGKGNGALSNAEGLRTAQHGYYSHITAVDSEFNRLLSILEETGQADNTIVIYTSDHGDMMGSHGYGGKRLPWEESCKVPFFVRYPGVTAQGSETNILFASVDIYPTVCGLAGIPVPDHCQGKDLSAAIRGQKVQSPESVFIMHISTAGAEDREINTAPLFRGVRTSRYTYAVAEDGRWCLYDNQEDPYQMRNLVGDHARNALMSDLDGLVLDWLRKASDPYPYASLVTKMSSAAS